MSGSVVFVAAGGRAVPLGVSRQLVGEAAFGAEGFQYCGNILTATDGFRGLSCDEALVEAACALAQAVADEFGLVGVNGIDFVARDGIPYAIEVNPRWCASMELVERAYGLSVFAAHASACTSGPGCLPSMLKHKRRGATRSAERHRRLRAAGRHRRRYTDVVDETRKHPRYSAARRSHSVRTTGLHDTCRRSGQPHLP